MSAPSLRDIVWLAGEPAVQRALEARFAERDARRAGPEASPPERDARALALLRTSHRRTLHRAELALPDGSPPRSIVLKTHHLATGRHPWRDALKRRLGRSPARREWQALAALSAAGLDVPTPLAWGRLASGDELVVQDFVPGLPLAQAFAEADAVARASLVDALARTLDRLTRSGWLHGDLHLGNLHLAADAGRIVLLDLERARPFGARAALRDLARLELSLVRAGWPIALRRRLRAGRARPAAFDAAYRRFLADHRRGRLRRMRARGDGVAVIACDGRRGLRDAGVDEQDLLELVARAEASPARALRRDGRTWIVEDVLAGRPVVVKGEPLPHGIGMLRGALRPSRAARAFRKGRLDRMLFERAAAPLAYLEGRGTWLVLERVGDFDLDRHQPASATAARALALALADWLAELHAAGLGHEDLKGGNVRVSLDGGEPRFWLVDLEDLTGPARLRDGARMRALVQLNASLADEAFPTAARTAALARYLERLPFDAPGLDLEAARRAIAIQSRARHHRFRGEGCACEAEGGLSRPPLSRPSR